MILKDFRPGTVLKLHDGAKPTGLYGYVMRQMSVETSDNEMAATFTCSTPAVDRRRDVVKTHGIDLSDHKLNPISLLGHNMEWRVGATEDKAGNYTAWMTPGPRFKAKIFYDQGTELGQQTYIAVKEKRLRGASIGFIPKPGMITKTTGPDGHPIQVYEACRLVEISTVPIPDNQECILEMVHKGIGGAQLCDPLMQYLKPLCPEKKTAVTGGYAANTVSKAMPPRDTLQSAQAADPMAPPADPAADPNDPAADPNAQDPNAAGANGHKETVDNAVADMMASWYMQLCDGIIDEKKFIDKMTHLAETRSVHIDAGGEGEGEEDLSADDEGDEDFDAEDNDDADPSPDLEDETKKKAEKACLAVWEKSYQPTMARVAKGMGHVAAHPDLCPTKAQAYVRKLLGCMEALPGINETVQKALAGGVSPAASAALAEAAAGPLYTALLRVQAEQDQVMAKLDEQDERLRAVTG